MSPVLDSTSPSQTDKVSDRSSPAKKTEPDPLLGSQEETEMNQMEKIIAFLCACACCAGWQSRLKAGARRWAVPSVVLNLLLIIITIILIIPIALFAMQHKPCPEGWVGHLGKCYYFSEDEADWPSSQSRCSTLGASLAVIDTQQEMGFMKRYKGPESYWIGLHRDPGQPWKWTSGTKLNNLFTVAGGETCAFMIGNDISSSSCSNKQRWICSK